METNKTTVRSTTKTARPKHSMVRRLAVVSAIFGMLLGLTMPALAGRAVSAPGYYNVGGESYKNSAAVRTDFSNQNWVVGTTFNSRSDRRDAAPGWIGARARLYRSNGSLVSQSGWRYNDRAMPTIAASTYQRPGPGVYYAKGLTTAWDGRGSYKTYNTFRSLNQHSTK